MAFNGSGTYVPPVPPTFPAVSGTSISSTYFNAIINDIVTALSTTICRDGQSTISADTSWNSKKITSLGTPTNAGDAATKAYVDAAVVGLLDFKGSTDCSANPNYPAASKGDAYVVSVAGKIGGASGVSVTVGDFYFATADNAGGTQAAVGASWDSLKNTTTGGLLAANNLSDVANATTSRTNLGLGTAATVATGTSGATVPLLNGANTHSGATTFSAGIDISTPLTSPTTTEGGYMGSPINTQNGTYTTVMSDRGKTIYHTSGSAHTFTIDSNANVAYPIGTIINFENENAAGIVTLAITSDTLRWGSSTGSRSLAANSSASAKKMTATSWRLVGSGIS